MASSKDKDYHKLRNPEQYPELQTKQGDNYGYRDQQSAEAYARYKTLWSKYGQKSMVSDKRRRNSTRKSNQKDKQTLHQIERAQLKSNLKKHIEDQDVSTKAFQRMGNIIHVR